MKLLFCSLLLMFSALAQAAEPRFDEVIFFQPEQVLLDKKVNFADLARFSRNMQSRIWNALKKVKMPVSTGYVVVAVRSDGEVAAWLDMEPALHEYYDNEVVQAVMKTPPFSVSDGIVVFGIKMAIDTAKHTRRTKPDPKEWKEARKKVANPNDIEELALAAWPE